MPDSGQVVRGSTSDDSRDAELRALREQNRRLLAIIDSIPDFVSLHRPNGELMFLNRAAGDFMEHAMSLPREQVVGRTFEEMGFPGEFVEVVMGLLRRALTGEDVSAEIERPAQGGKQWRWVQHSPVRDERGNIEAVVISTRNIHDRKLAEFENARLTAQLEKAVVFREQLVAILAHDLRNPLSAVRGLVALVLRRDDTSEEARRDLAQVDRSAKRMVEMIGALLDVVDSRFLGRLAISREPGDFREIVGHAIEELRAAHPERAIELAAPAPVLGSWDAARIAQVVTNLVGNALAHGDRAEAVRVTVTGLDEGVTLAVHNRGPTIAEEALPGLFEPFQRARVEGSEHRGLGLGLYIVAQLMAAHAGTVSVESAAGSTTFTVRVPLD